MDREISAHLLRLRRSHPFFAALSMFARYEFTASVQRCETDAERVYVSPDYFKQLPTVQQTGLLLHVTLHAALLHPTRRGLREPRVWNTAADIVVNNLITDSGEFVPPEGTAVEPEYRDLSVEQVYERLMALPRQHPGMLSVASSMSGDSGSVDDGKAASPPQQPTDKTGACKPNDEQSKPIGQGSAGAAMRAKIADAIALRYPTHTDLRDTDADSVQAAANRATSHWRAAFRKAEAAARLAGQQRGEQSAGMARELEQVLGHRLDWRTRLWRYLVRTPSDFSGFDRRFIHQGLYLDALESDSLTVYLAVDTSGSVDDESLAQFLGEVRGVKHAYNFIDIALYFIDADLTGPFPVDDSLNLPAPVGGGGTDFRPFFDEVAERAGPFDQALIVYLTDGYGRFPNEPPKQETLWVVSEGGTDYFPFGEVARLADTYASNNTLDQ